MNKLKNLCDKNNATKVKIGLKIYIKFDFSQYIIKVKNARFPNPNRRHLRNQIPQHRLLLGTGCS